MISSMGRGIRECNLDIPTLAETVELTLSLFELRIFLVDYINHPVAADHLALRGSFLYRNSDFHSFYSFCCYFSLLSSLFVTIGYTTLGQVIRRHLYLDFVTREYSDVMHAHLA